MQLRSSIREHSQLWGTIELSRKKGKRKTLKRRRDANKNNKKRCQKETKGKRETGA